MPPVSAVSVSRTWIVPNIDGSPVAGLLGTTASLTVPSILMLIVVFARERQLSSGSNRVEEPSDMVQLGAPVGSSSATCVQANRATGVFVLSGASASSCA